MIREIVSGALAPQPASYSLVGSKLAGKSSLLEYLASPDGPLLGDDSADLRPYAFQDAGRIVVTQIDCAWQEAQQDLLVFLCDRLIRQLRTVERIDLDWAAVEGQSSASRRIWQISRQLNHMGYRLILLMDNFDAVFQNQLLTPDAIDELRPLTLETALVVATEHPLHDLDRELAASPLFNVMTQLFVGLIETEAALHWVHAYCAAYPDILPACDDLLELTGCHPFLLHRLGDILAEVQTMLASRQPLGRAYAADPAAAGGAGFRCSSPPCGDGFFFFFFFFFFCKPAPCASSRPSWRCWVACSPRAAAAQRSDPRAVRSLNWLINQAMVIYGAPVTSLFRSLPSFCGCALAMPLRPGSRRTPIALPLLRQLDQNRERCCVISRRINTRSSRPSNCWRTYGSGPTHPCSRKRRSAACVCVSTRPRRLSASSRTSAPRLSLCARPLNADLPACGEFRRTSRWSYHTEHCERTA